MKKLTLALIAAIALAGCSGHEQKTEQTAGSREHEENKTATAAAPVNTSDRFFANLDKEDGIKSTASGLRYKAVKETEGDKPTPTSRVVVDYEGSCIDGNVFDSGKDIEFPLNGVIPGFSEGIRLMSPGSEYILYIPSDLAYGTRGAGDVIPPNSTIIFKVNLSEIK